MPTSTEPLGRRVPKAGESVEVARGVHWIRLPMPYKLDHINVWAIEEADGWALVDTGMRTEQTVASWEQLISRPPFNKPLARVIVTHMHPDHIGMAGWLTRRYGVQLWISRLEYLTCRVLVSDSGREAPPDALKFYREAGWSEAALAGYRARFGGFGSNIYALPDSYVRMQDGETLRIGEDDWEVVTGNGHSPEHVCLYNAGRKLLISGDQVLPKISSNVSVFPIEPEADPMADWLASLDKLEARLPDDLLVLPAHNDCFRGLHGRIRDLRSKQLEAFDRLREQLAQPRRVVDVFPALFRGAVTEADVAHLGFATGEAIACLNHMVKRGQASREVKDGVAWYVNVSSVS